MARVTHEKANSLQGKGGNSLDKDTWFKLKDGQSATIQFIGAEDIAVYSVHKVEVTTNTGTTFRTNIDCLDDGEHSCPMCNAGLDVTPICVVTMFDHAANKVKIWERSYFSKFIKKLNVYADNYDPISDHVFKIVRIGSTMQNTVYELLPQDKEDPYDLSDIVVPEIMGTVIQIKTAQEMEAYLSTGNFPFNQKKEEDDISPVRRRKAPEQPKESVPTQRRTRRPEVTKKPPEPEFMEADPYEWLTAEESEDVPF